jgi:hypothetical protein
MARDLLLLTASRGEFEDSYDVQPLTHQLAFERMNSEDQKLRRLLRKTQNDDQLASKVIRNLSKRSSNFDIQPIRIIATMLIIQKNDPDSIGAVCQKYEAAITTHELNSKGVKDVNLTDLLRKESYPCCFYIDGDLIYEDLTISDFLTKLQRTHESRNGPSRQQ